MAEGSEENRRRLRLLVVGVDFPVKKTVVVGGEREREREREMHIRL
jgi:hypothetical protein